MNHAVRFTRPRRISSERSVQSLRLLPPRLSPAVSWTEEEESPKPGDDSQGDDKGAPRRPQVVGIQEVWGYLPTETPQHLSRVLLRIAKCYQESERHSGGTSL